MHRNWRKQRSLSRILFFWYLMIWFLFIFGLWFFLRTITITTVWNVFFFYWILSRLWLVHVQLIHASSFSLSRIRASYSRWIVDWIWGPFFRMFIGEFLCDLENLDQECLVFSNPCQLWMWNSLYRLLFPRFLVVPLCAKRLRWMTYDC